MSMRTDVSKYWSREAVLAWCGWVAVVLGGFAYLEYRGMKKRRDGDPTLTAVISRYVPGWAWFLGLGAFKGWLDWHFDQAYASWRTSRPAMPR